MQRPNEIRRQLSMIRAKHDVYILRNTSPLSQKLKLELEKQGLNCWIDRDADSDDDEDPIKVSEPNQIDQLIYTLTANTLAQQHLVDGTKPVKRFVINIVNSLTQNGDQTTAFRLVVGYPLLVTPVVVFTEPSPEKWLNKEMTDICKTPGVITYDFSELLIDDMLDKGWQSSLDGQEPDSNDNKDRTTEGIRKLIEMIQAAGL
jgi:hypothetical protein